MSVKSVRLSVKNSHISEYLAVCVSDCLCHIYAHRGSHHYTALTRLSKAYLYRHTVYVAPSHHRLGTLFDKANIAGPCRTLHVQYYLPRL